MGGGTVGRVVTGIATGGLSEVARQGVKAVTPKIPGIPPVPTASKDNGGLTKKSDEARRKARKRKGRQSTILTGSSSISPLGAGNEKGVLG